MSVYNGNININININIDFKQFVKVYDCQYIILRLTLTLTLKFVPSYFCNKFEEKNTHFGSKAVVGLKINLQI